MKDWQIPVLLLFITISNISPIALSAKKKNVVKVSNIEVPEAPKHSTNFSKHGDSWPLFPTVPNPEIPLAMAFAGEKIDLDRLDMFERLDRELTSMTYGHSNILLTLKRANRYFPMIVPILKKYDVPEDFVYLAAIESYLNVRAYSGAKAAGMWQILEGTARQYGLEVSDEVDERYDPEKATVAAAKYLKAAYRKYGDWTTVAASYNAGMGRISRELKSQIASNSFDLYLNDETSRYVFRILAMREIFSAPKAYGYSLTARQLYQPINYKEVEVSGAVESWSSWAKDYNITFMQLRELNPWIRRKSLTNAAGKTYKVKIPLENELYRSKRNFKAYNKKWVSE